MCSIILHISDDEMANIKEKDELIEEPEEEGESVYGSGGKWPQAPPVEQVNQEAQRLATQAIQRAAEMHMKQAEYVYYLLFWHDKLGLIWLFNLSYSMY